MRSLFRLKPPIVALFALLGLALSACQSLPYAQQGVLPPPVVVTDASPERRALNARVFDATVKLIAEHYYDPAYNGHDWPAMAAAARDEAIAQETEAAFYSVLSPLVDALDDRHTSVTSPTVRAQEEATRTGQSSVGYGFGALRQGERWFVYQMRADGPAAEAGVQIGWRMVSINGSTAFRAISPIEGQTDVFVFEDEQGVERTLSITAVRLEPRPQQQATRRDDGVLVLRFNAFDKLSLDWMNTQMDAIQADPPRAVILDLRDNPGGYSGVLGDVIAMYVRESTDFMLLDHRFVDHLLHTRTRPQVWDGPIAVLIGPASGSASELLAAHMQDIGRGQVVGQTSAGSVIGSRSLNLPDGGELSLSMVGVLTGQRRVLLEGVGVTPDVLVEPTLEDRRARRDPALEAAAALLLKD